MNRGRLRSSFRARAGDQKRPYLWSDDEVDSYINEAYFEAVERGLMIYDRESFTVDVEIGVTEYPLDARIIRVKTATVTAKDGVELDNPEPMEMVERKSGFMFRQMPDLQGFRIDEDGMFVLAVKPVATTTIALGAYCYPESLADDEDEPAIASIYHEKMLYWALKLAYQKQDADALNATKAMECDAEFTRVFGPAKTAQQHRQRRRNSARSIKTPWF